MSCKPEILKSVPLFSLLDDDETALLAAQVETKTFAARQRIYKAGDAGLNAYVLLSGRVRVTTVDEDQQEVVVDEPGEGEFFGFASMIQETAHQTTAVALDEAECLEISRDDITALLERKPHAGMDLLTTLGRQLHASQQLVRIRAMRNPNEIIDKQETFGERIADAVAGFGGSWTFIITFLVVLVVYSTANVLLGKTAWDPYPFILLNLFLSMLAALQAPVIMMSQNRQATKDRLQADQDYQVNIKAEFAIQQLHRKLDEMRASLTQQRHAEAEHRRKVERGG